MSWKDTLNVPISSQGEWSAKRFYGDPKLAAAYLPLAYTMLGVVKNRMALGDVGFGHQIAHLPDGTVIRVLRNGNQNILEIETVPVVGREEGYTRFLFLETGWVYLDRTNFLSDEYKPPGSITLTNAMIAALSVGQPPLDEMVVPQIQGAKIKGFEFKSRTYTQKMDSVSLPEYAIFERPEADLRSPEEKAMAHKSQMARHYFNGAALGYRLYPSAVTGKAKLLFQSALGRNAPTEQSIVTFGSLPYDSNTGSGLYTTDGLDYYWVRIVNSTGVVTVSRILTVEPLFSLVRQALLVNKGSLSDERFTQIETYLLSLVGLRLSAPVLILEGVNIIGSALAYGWSFSWQGREASLVTHEVKNDGYTRTARKYTVRLKDRSGYDPGRPWGQDNAPLSASWSLDETRDWWPTLSCPIWVPVLALGKMALATPKQKSGYEFFAFDVPLYCFYDHASAGKVADSALSTVRLNVELGDDAPDPYAAVINHLAAQESYTPTSFAFSATRTHLSTRLYTTGVDYGGSSPETINGTLDLNIEENGQIFETSTYTNYGGNGISEVRRWGEWFESSTFLVLPFYSAEAAFIGEVRTDKKRDDTFKRSASLISKIVWEDDTALAGTYPARLSLAMYPSGDISVGLGNCGGGVSDCSQVTTESLFQEWAHKLKCKVVHSRGAESVTFGGAEEWVIVRTSTAQPFLPGFGKWDVVWFPNPSNPGDPGEFWLYAGISDAAFMTNDISKPDDLWAAKGGLTLDEKLTGYFVGWA